MRGLILIFAIFLAMPGYGQNFFFSHNTPVITLPTVTTTNATVVTNSSCTTGGNVTSDGGASVTGRGVCYAKTTDPTLASSHTSDGTGTGAFTSYLSGLDGSSTYYVRAYATNSVNTAYGNQVSFTTSSSGTKPTVTTAALSAITDISATGGGNVTDQGGSSVTARGVCWYPGRTPTIADYKTTDGTGTGSFTSSLTSLSSCTYYGVRAYATNTAGTAYGDLVILHTAIPASCIYEYYLICGTKISGVQTNVNGTCARALSMVSQFGNWDPNTWGAYPSMQAHNHPTVGDVAYGYGCTPPGNGWYPVYLVGSGWIQSHFHIVQIVNGLVGSVIEYNGACEEIN